MIDERDAGYHEDDESLKDVHRACEMGEHGLTRRPYDWDELRDRPVRVGRPVVAVLLLVIFGVVVVTAAYWLGRLVSS